MGWRNLADVLEEDTTQTVDELERMYPTPVYGYVCEKCLAEFSTNAKLQGHVRRGKHR